MTVTFAKENNLHVPSIDSDSESEPDFDVKLFLGDKESKATEAIAIKLFDPKKTG